MPWDTVCHNYTARTRKALAQLVGLRRPDREGRLLLWHGEPGTGKTRATMTLMAEWSGWCDSEVVDPERSGAALRTFLRFKSLPQNSKRICERNSSAGRESL